MNLSIKKISIIVVVILSICFSNVFTVIAVTPSKQQSTKAVSDTTYLKYYAAELQIIKDNRGLSIISSDLVQMCGDKTPELVLFFKYGDSKRRGSILVSIYTYDFA